MDPEAGRDQRRVGEGPGRARRAVVAASRSRDRRLIILFGRTGWSFAFVFAIYAYQGLVAGFALTALPNHHAAMGASAAELGWHAALVGLPWVLQPAWGPVVDRFNDFRMGRRRFWAAVALAGSTAAVLALLAVDDRSAIGSTSPILAAHGAFAALLDTAVDGMIIDRVPPDGLGRANACTRAGFVSGIAAGAALFAWVLPAHGLDAAALLLAAAGALASALLALLREEPTDVWLSLRRRRAPPGAAPAAERTLGRVLRRFLAPMLRRQSLVLIAFCLAVEGAVAVVQLRTGLDLIQGQGWDAPSLSRLQASLGLLGGTLGALVVGWLSDRLGALRGLAAILLLDSAAHAALALLLARSISAAAPLAVGLAAAFPVLVFVALAPAVMRASRCPGAATRFALFMAALNLGGVGGSAVAGVVGTGLPLWAPVLAAACVFAGCAFLARRPHLLFRRPVAGVAA
jgi:PAT family beta-lactamase induction signal transducer AmpG